MQILAPEFLLYIIQFIQTCYFSHMLLWLLQSRELYRWRTGINPKWIPPWPATLSHCIVHLHLPLGSINWEISGNSNRRDTQKRTLYCKISFIAADRSLKWKFTWSLMSPFQTLKSELLCMILKNTPKPKTNTKQHTATPKPRSDC